MFELKKVLLEGVRSDPVVHLGGPLKDPHTHAATRTETHTLIHTHTHTQHTLAHTWAQHSTQKPFSKPRIPPFKQKGPSSRGDTSEKETESERARDAGKKYPHIASSAQVCTCVISLSFHFGVQIKKWSHPSHFCRPLDRTMTRTFSYCVLSEYRINLLKFPGRHRIS